MTLGELCEDMFAARDAGSLKEAPHRVRLFVYDPGVEDYVEATGFAMRPEGGIELRTPA